MGNLKNNYSEHIKFYIITDDNPALLVDNVIGWNKYGLDAARNMDYHGTMVQVTKTLGFTKAAKQAILGEFNKNGVLSNLSVIVSRLKERDNEVVWVDDDPIYADFYKMSIKDEVLTLSFNSNNLMDLIDAYEDEDVYIERLEDFEKRTIPSMTQHEIELKGRSLIAIGESVVRRGYFEDINGIEYLDYTLASGRIIESTGIGDSDVNWINSGLITVDSEEFVIEISEYGSNSLADAERVFMYDENDNLTILPSNGLSTFIFTKPQGIVKINIQIDNDTNIGNDLENSTYLDRFNIKKGFTTFTEDYTGASGDWNVITDFVNQGPTRHSTTDVKISSLTASRMFYVNSTTEDVVNDVKVEIFVTGNKSIISAPTGETLASLNKYSYNEETATYDLIETTGLFFENGETTGEIVFNLNTDISLRYNESLSLMFSKYIRIKFSVYNVKISEVQRFNPSYNIKFQFVNDVINRLMLIISGKSNLLYSSIFKQRESENEEDGKYSLLGLISGIQARGYDPSADGYESPIFSLVDVKSSLSNILNLGFGVEKINNKEYLVAEELDYFYRKETIGSFKSKINNVERSIDSSHYYSSIELGYKRGGNYSNRIGLDEPNVKNNFITPINNISSTFTKTSELRADEYGLEIVRRVTYEDSPDENVSGQENNWLLDIKRSDESDSGFEQVDWSDRLSELPTNIHSPETFRSMLFTPVACLKRLASNFKSGLYLYKDKFISYTSSDSKSELNMKFIGDEDYCVENSDILIGDLSRPIFKNETIKFTHPYSEELREMIFGKTIVNINGVDREVPNFYFKMEWLNENDEIERGYFLKYEYTDNPTFEFQIANEDII